MTHQIRPRMVDEPGVLFGIATGIVVVTDLLAGAFTLPAVPTALALVVVAGLFGARLKVLLAAALGLIAWAFYTGFTEHRFGQLTLADGDLVRIGAFVAGALAIAVAMRRVQAAAQQGVEVRHG